MLGDELVRLLDEVAPPLRLDEVRSLRPNSRWRRSVWLVAAAVVLLAGTGAAWLALRDRSPTIVSTDISATTTTTSPVPDTADSAEGLTVRSWLLPDAESWTVSSSWSEGVALAISLAPDASEAENADLVEQLRAAGAEVDSAAQSERLVVTADRSLAEVAAVLVDADLAELDVRFGEPEGGGPQRLWAWRDGDALVLLVSPFESGGVSLDAAEVTESPGRSLLAWQGEAGSVGLLGIGLDATEVRATAARLRPTPAGWELDGATQLAGDHLLGRSVATLQLDFEGPAGERITMVSAPGTIGDALGTLFDASSAGQVTERRIGELDIFVAGDQVAVAAGDGTSLYIQSDSGAELGPFLDSLQPTSIDAVLRAVADTAPSPTEELDTAPQLDVEPVGDLPRFVLPAPFELTTVWDLGLLGADAVEQQRGREDFVTLDVIRSQGLVRTDSTGVDPTVPRLADIVITVGTPALSDPGFPYSDRLGPLPAQIIDAGGVGSDVEARTEDLTIQLVADRIPHEQMRAIAGSITLRSDDVRDGFDVPGFDTLFELTGDEAAFADPYLGGWSAIWTDTDGTEIRVQVTDTSSATSPTATPTPPPKRPPTGALLWSPTPARSISSRPINDHRSRHRPRSSPPNPTPASSSRSRSPAPTP